MVDWPEGIPFFTLRSGYGAQPGENTLRTPMDVGPAKVRRRTTAAPSVITGSAYMTREQAQRFEQFWRDALKDGALSFAKADGLYRRRNLLVQSEDFSAGWVKSAELTRSDAASVIPNATASRYDNSGTVGSRSIVQGYGDFASGGYETGTWVCETDNRINDFADFVGWTRLGMSAPSASRSYLPSRTASRFTGLANAEPRIQSETVVATGSVYRASFVIENMSGSRCAVGIRDLTGGAWAVFCRYNWSTKTATLEQGAGLATVEDLGTGPNGGAMVRFTVMADAGQVAAGRSIQAWCYPFDSPPTALSAIVHLGQLYNSHDFAFGIRNSTDSLWFVIYTYTWSTRAVSYFGGSGTATARQIGIGPNGGDVVQVSATGNTLPGKATAAYLYPTGVAAEARSSIVHWSQAEAAPAFTTYEPVGASYPATHVTRGGGKTYRIVGVPQFAPMGIGHRVSVSLEVIP